MRWAALDVPFPPGSAPYPTPLANPALSTQVSAHPDLQDSPSAASLQHTSGSRAASIDRPQPPRGNASQSLSPFISCTRGVCSQEGLQRKCGPHRFFEAAVWFSAICLALAQSHLPSDGRARVHLSPCPWVLQAKETLSLSQPPCHFPHCLLLSFFFSPTLSFI